MFVKLLKYDVKYTFRIISVVILLALATSLVFSASLFLSEKVPGVILFSMIMLFPYLISIVALSASPFVVMCVRSYKNLYSDEGYLTFTLPVTSTQIIFSKVVTYLLLTVVTFAAFAVCVGIPMLVVTYSFATEGIFDFIRLVMDYMIFTLKSYVDFTKDGLTAFAVINVLNIVISCISTPILILFSFSVGQLVNKYKLLMAFLVYYMFNFVSNTLISVINAVVSPSNDLLVEESIQQFELAALTQTTLTSTVVTAVLTVSMFFVTRHIMSKKLNLI